MYNILLITSIFGFVLTTLFFFKKSTNSKATFFLGSFYFLLSFYALHAFVIDGGHLEEYPGFFLWPLVPFNLIFVPVYFYFLLVIEDQFRWRKRHLLLFVPMLLAMIDVAYVFLSPDSVYDDLFYKAVTNPKDRLQAHYWLLGLTQHHLMRHICQLAALLVLLPKLLNFMKEEREDKLKRSLNKWLMTFWSILMFMSLGAILYAVEKILGKSLFNLLFFNFSHSDIIVPLVLYLVVFCIGIIPIYFPTILQGYPQFKKVTPVTNKGMGETGDLKFGLEETEIKEKLELISQNKLYLQKDFNVSLCARELEMPAHHISYFLKKYYGLSFTSYKNNLRMEHAKEMIAKDFLSNNTMEALAWECGFSSRSSFSKAFKSATGLSPSEYMQNLQPND
ncbi:Helix-turn-helix domain-containing protein [Arenibacter nanhaiticus]|uniref:Helix-turn-helix domain-containing protein n=1 Tax=Arenibacter nanhaiticus TaxID=558155 RepID=A0A1M6LMD6_9FLAO|nr:helix-turn-helix domain-containing protein [Arenibacter nanhaiticus]SHJ72304.1 Helix-turn-helix domain-containing protein [Arenibacter nanhaiticus]